ncbi:MAG TPA: RNA methyltransferase [bacterium]|nr:RNA methyltransferase [bacterium]
MTKNLRPQDVTFILVKPRYGGNIGAACRVLKNMGFSKLHLVRPSVLPTHPESLRLAVGAADLARKAKVFDSLNEAAKGLRFLIGTSRRTGKYRRDFANLPGIGDKLLRGQKIGILFGAEERGLTNEELGHCNLVVQIPSNPDFPSLNLAQSVAVTAYQLRLLQDMGEPDDSLKKFPLAPVQEVEGMFQHLEKTLTTIGFLHERNGFHMMRTIRQLFGRTQMNEREVRIIRGICRQIQWAVKNGMGS